MEWYWWVVAALALAVVEVTTLDLVFIMLAAGATAGAVASAVGAPLVLQVVVAAVVAVLMLAVVRPVALRHLRQPAHTRTGVAALEGSWESWSSGSTRWTAGSRSRASCGRPAPTTRTE